MVSVAFGVSATPAHRCCTRSSRRHPSRASFLPLHLFGSHCAKSHIASGTGNRVGAAPFSPSSSSSSSPACLRPHASLVHEQNEPPPPRAQSGSTERPPLPPRPPPPLPPPRPPRPRAMFLEISASGSPLRLRSTPPASTDDARIDGADE